ncbi:MAG TPA: hypothetical protein PK306_10365 [Aquabacterium sp.]|nr:hypothetical protein [Aquabacterium sp.]HQC96098.1 hypothetical protein [Aquabacterium sp.]
MAARLVKAALEQSVAPADAAWADEAGRRAARHDALLAAVAAREGPWRRCSGERAPSLPDAEGFGRLSFEFAGGLKLSIKTLPPETSVISLQRPGGLAPKDDWIDLLRRYAAERGVPVDWSRPRRVTAADGSTSLRYGSLRPSWNAAASVDRDAAGRLVGLTLSLAL